MRRIVIFYIINMSFVQAEKLRKTMLSRSNKMYIVILWSQTFSKADTFKNVYFKTWRIVKFPIQNYAFPKGKKMRKPSLSRSNMIHNITLWIQTVFQNLHVFNFLIQYPKRCKILVQFLMPFKFFAPKLCFPKRHGKCRSRHFLGVTWFILWFCEFTFFQNITRFENF